MFAKHRLFIAALFCVMSFACSFPVECIARKLSLTVYNQDLGYVRDRREISLNKGLNEIDFPGVPSRIDPTSVRVLFPGGKSAARVLSQSYRYDTAEMGRFLELALGQEVEVGVRRGELFRGVLIGFDADALFLRGQTSMLNKKDEAVVAVRREHVTDVRFPDVGGNLELRPTLSWWIESPGNSATEIEAGYLVAGMNWHVEYAASIESNDGPMRLSAWASVDNRSGGDFEDAALTLVAGAVGRAQAPAPRRMAMMEADAMTAGFAEQENLFEYHAYALHEALTIKNNETVQLPFFEPAAVTAERIYTYDPTRLSGGVSVTAETENTEAMGLGRPMPQGKVRVYASDEAGESRLVGEDMLAETPVGAKMTLSLGMAFDVKGERKRTNYVRRARNDYEESYEITLKNSKSGPVDVRVIEHPQGDWTITAATHEFEAKDSNTVQWIVTAPPTGKVTISYTVNFRS